MRRRCYLSAVLGISAAITFAGEPALKSGPQPGQKVPGPFNPLHANGPNKGEKLCLV